jgi:putative MFS transporter
MAGAAPATPTSADVSPLEAAVGARLDEATNWRARFWAPLILGLIMLFDSWDGISIAYVMPSLSKEWHLNPVSIGAMISAGYAGQFIGSLTLGALAERWGRMPVFYGAVVLMACFALAQAFVTSYEMLFALRMIQGIAIGGALPVCITYINEMAPTQTRGRYFAFFQFLAMAGYGAAAFASIVVVPYLGWRWMLGIGAIPLALLPLVFLTLPESPRWLARRGRIGELNKALAKLRCPLVPEDISTVRAGAPATAAADRVTFAALFAPIYLRRTLILILLWFLTHLTSFGLTTWMPTLYVSSFGMAVPEALKYGAIKNAMFLLVSPTVGLLIDRFGRRPPAIIGSLLSAIPMLVLGFWHPDSTLGLVALASGGQIGISVAAIILWPYSAEVYPTKVRAMALGLVGSVARVAAMTTPLAVGLILSLTGSAKPVFFLFGACAVGAIIVWVVATKETARKSLEAIDAA